MAAKVREPARRRSRRANVPGGRSVRHYVKVSAEEETALTRVAAARGVTVARLLVESALSGDGRSAAVHAELADELFGISRALGKVGVNVNQIARVTNATGEVQPQTEAALAALGRVCVRIEEVLADLPNGRAGSAAAGMRR